jgi:hypothetical protein
MDIVGDLNGFQIHFNKPTLRDKPKKYPKGCLGMYYVTVWFFIGKILTKLFFQKLSLAKLSM